MCIQVHTYKYAHPKSNPSWHMIKSNMWNMHGLAVFRRLEVSSSNKYGYSLLAGKLPREIAKSIEAMMADTSDLPDGSSTGL